MKFLADENLPRSILKFFRKKNFNVKDLQEEGLRGISDDKICRLARKEGRIVLTYDKDFLVGKPGEITCSVIIFHFPKITPKEVIPYLEPLIEGISSRKTKRPFVILLREVLHFYHVILNKVKDLGTKCRSLLRFARFFAALRMTKVQNFSY